MESVPNFRSDIAPSDFEKKTPIEHILHAPDTYIGSSVVTKQTRLGFNHNKIVNLDILTCEGIERLFIEIISNAIDNIINTRNMNIDKDIKTKLYSTKTPPVIVNVTDTTVTIQNGGVSIPIAPHPSSTTKNNLVLVPELIFGELLSSSNYNKSVARATAGRNGYGAKLVNIFSLKFEIEIGDPKYGQHYHGVWTNNMSKREKSEATPGYSYSEEKGEWVSNGDEKVKRGKHKIYNGPAFVKVVYNIDFSHFKPLLQYSSELISVFARICLDYTFSSKIPIKFNDELLDARSPKTFAKIYFSPSSTNEKASVEETESPTNEESTNDNSLVNRAIVWYEWKSKIDSPKDLTDLCGGLTGKDAIVKSISNGTIKELPLVEMVILDTPDNAQYYSFVNGLSVPEGVHINEAIKKVCFAFLNASSIATKNSSTISFSDVKNHISIILNCNLINPIFTSQTKQKLAEPTPKITINSTAFKPTLISKWELNSRLIETSAIKTQRMISKTDAKHRKKRILIDAGEDANFAGSDKSNSCVLYLCEGESASGMIKKRIELLGGKDVNGYFPMKGKSLNVTTASTTAALANKEFTNIKKLIGLAEGADYSKQTVSNSLLRYGKIIIAADQDVDGFHVRSLLINMFASKWPSLIKEGKIAYLATPLIRVIDSKTGKCVNRFFNEHSFDEWLSKQPSKSVPKGLKVSYYKGLASSSNSEIKEDLSFSPTVVLLFDDSSKESLSLAFDKKRANDRKNWILNWKNTCNLGFEDFELKAIQDVLKENVKKVPQSNRPLSNIINTDLATYSADTLFRAIPSQYDGLKRSQRQAIYHALEYWNYKSPYIKCNETVKDSVKISRLASAAAERVLYQHGEKSLMDTYTNLAQDIIGTNNLPILDRAGQFGTRNTGKDVGAGRYIGTRLDWVAPLLCSRENTLLVKQRVVEGEQVEPEWIPFMLPIGVINGSLGIGTGFQSSIPAHHPIEVADWLLNRIDGNPTKSPSPWYNGFKGRIYISEEEIESSSLCDEEDDDNVEVKEPKGQRKVVIKGVFTIDRKPSEKNKTYDITITELPIRVWTSPYRKWLETLESVGVIDNVKDESTTETVKFIVKGLDTIKIQDKQIIKTVSCVQKEKDVQTKKSKKVNDDQKPIIPLENIPPPTFEMLKLVKTMSLRNMTMIDNNGVPTIFKDVNDILETYTINMLSHFEDYKSSKIKVLKEELNELTEKYKLIHAIVTKKLIIFDVDETEVISNINKMKLSTKIFETIKIRECTMEKVEVLKKKIESTTNELETIEKTPSSNFWKQKIVEFKKEYCKRNK